MELRDLLLKPISELSDEELEARLKTLKQLKIGRLESKKGKGKTNEDKRTKDLLSKLSKDDIAALLKELM